MSNIVLQPNANGTGNITIATPNTNTDRTLNIPDVAGNIVTTGDTGTISAAMMNSTQDFTGKTFTNPNGWNLLETKEDTSPVDYTNSVQIFDFSSHTSTYNNFMIDLYLYSNATAGSVHVYNAFYDNSSALTGQKTLRYLHDGYSQDGSNATPSYGQGSYWLTGFGVQNQTAYTHQMHICNGRLSDTSLDVNIQCHSTWYREGSGVTQASGACQVIDGAQIAKYALNLDSASSSAAEDSRVYARLWGMF